MFRRLIIATTLRALLISQQVVADVTPSTRVALLPSCSPVDPYIALLTSCISISHQKIHLTETTLALLYYDPEDPSTCAQMEALVMLRTHALYLSYRNFVKLGEDFLELHQEICAMRKWKDARTEQCPTITPPPQAPVTDWSGKTITI